MKRTAFLAALLLPVAVLAQDFAGPAATRTIGAVRRQAAALVKSVATKESDGHTIHAKVGGRLEVYLPAQMSTGYGWDIVQNDPKIIEPQGRPTLGEIDPKNGMGREQMEVFVFSVKAAGSAELKMAYRRPWDKGARPLDTFHVTIVAK